MILTLIGRPYAGKTTTADLVEAELFRRGREVVRVGPETAAEILVDSGIHALAHEDDIETVLGSDFTEGELDRLRPAFARLDAAGTQGSEEQFAQEYARVQQKVECLLSVETRVQRLSELFASVSGRGLDVIVDGIADPRLLHELSAESLLVELVVSPVEQIRRGFDRDGIVIDDPGDNDGTGLEVDLSLHVDGERPSAIVTKVLDLIEEWDAAARADEETTETLDTGMTTREIHALSGFDVSVTVSFYNQAALTAALEAALSALGLDDIVVRTARQHGIDLASPAEVLAFAASPLAGELALNAAYGDDLEPVIVTTRATGAEPVPVLIAAMATLSGMAALLENEQSAR